MKSTSALAVATLICGFTLTAGNALAGVPEAAGSSAQQQAPSAPASPDTGAQAGTTYSDTEIEAFAKAVLAVQKIQQDTTASAAAKQTKMAAAVQQSGLTPTKFNEIARASNTDPVLMQRIQAAAGKVQSGPAG